MKIISGEQTGVDRAALDVAIERSMSWGGWCPKGGWAEDLPDPPGLLNKYPKLRETPSSQPEQRTEWNVRDSDAILIITNREGLAVSKGTKRAQEWADRCGKPLLVVDVGQPDAVAQVAQWLRAQRQRFGAHMALGVGGPRESEAPGIYTSTRELIAGVLDHVER
jgi:Circularly permutated YpsA SLOG family